MTLKVLNLIEEIPDGFLLQASEYNRYEACMMLWITASHDKEDKSSGAAVILTKDQTLRLRKFIDKLLDDPTL